MSKKKSNANPGPHRNRFRGAQWLDSAKNYLPAYTGNKLVKAYRKRYGVDWRPAFTEVGILGVPIDPARAQRTGTTYWGAVGGAETSTPIG